MILQPLVENSIKHGLGRKVGEGRITIRSLREGGHAIIEVDRQRRRASPTDGRSRVKGTASGCATSTSGCA